MTPKLCSALLCVVCGSIHAADKPNIIFILADGHPNIAPNWPADGSILYFDSDRPGGHGGADMYQATWHAGPFR